MAAVARQTDHHGIDSERVQNSMAENGFLGFNPNVND
jgi:hypothetical protein